METSIQLTRLRDWSCSSNVSKTTIQKCLTDETPEIFKITTKMWCNAWKTLSSSIFDWILSFGSDTMGRRWGFKMQVKLAVGRRERVKQCGLLSLPGSGWAHTHSSMQLLNVLIHPSGCCPPRPTAQIWHFNSHQVAQSCTRPHFSLCGPPCAVIDYFWIKIIIIVIKQLKPKEQHVGAELLTGNLIVLPRPNCSLSTC